MQQQVNLSLFNYNQRYPPFLLIYTNDLANFEKGEQTFYGSNMATFGASRLILSSYSTHCSFSRYIMWHRLIRVFMENQQRVNTIYVDIINLFTESINFFPLYHKRAHQQEIFFVNRSTKIRGGNVNQISVSLSGDLSFSICISKENI